MDGDGLLAQGNVCEVHCQTASLPDGGALDLPSIVVTLGMSFVWLGIAVLILPTPGGKSPDVIKAVMALKLPLVPFPIVAAAVIALIVHLGLMHSSYGAVLRGAGGNPRALARAGWSMLRIKMAMFAYAGAYSIDWLTGLYK